MFSPHELVAAMRGLRSIAGATSTTGAGDAHEPIRNPHRVVGGRATDDRRLDCNRERYLNQRLRACDLEAWYPSLQDVTFPAVFLPISMAEARAIVAKYKATRRRVPQHTNEGRGEDDGCSVFLSRLIHRIEAAVKPFAIEWTGQPLVGAPGPLQPGESPSFPSVFVKLSSRSPKDADARQHVARGLARGRLQQWCMEHPGATPDGNALADAIFFGSINCLRLESAGEVIATLCSSDRVCEDDIPLALSFPRSWSQHIVLRPWVDIPTAHEFRAFVIGGRLTGLSQYFTAVHYPALKAHKAAILAAVQRFFSGVKDRVPIREPADYAMDLAVDPHSGTVKIIEFNPFGAPDGMGTGTALFDLSVPHDSAVLFGEAPMECRVVESTIDNVEERIKGDWRTFMVQEGYLTS